MNVLDAYTEALTLERDGLDAAITRADETVVEAIELLYGCRGRVVVSGMGKCGYVGQKLAATFASTGTPATFLHPAEAIHGDLGYVDEDDVALVLSNSGETAEIVTMLPHLQRMGVKMVGMTGRPESTLGRASTVVVDTSVPREACPINMAPTTSTTTMLAVGDALAVVLMRKRDFGKQAYAVFHPGGSLGQKLLCTVEQLMHAGDEVPVVREDAIIRDAIYEITSKRLGATFVVDQQQRLAGILTDGDLRRIFQRDEHPLDLTVRACMTQRPITIRKEMLAVDALRLMEDKLITLLPVVDDREQVLGALHIHYLIRAGIG